MSDPRDFSVEDENQLYREFAAFEQQRNSYRNNASQELSEIVDRLVRNAPQIEPGVALAAAQAVRAGSMSFDDAVRTAQGSVQAQVQMAQPAPESGRGFLGRLVDNVHEKFKSGVKWGVAGLEFVPQVVTNLGSRAYNQFGSPGDRNLYQGPKTDLWDGLVASTDLGSLMSGVQSGTGYFIGEAALEQQQEKVREYRGTIGDDAWTFGRGFAVSIAQPGSREYNILSGVVDAAAALAIPSVPGGKLISKGLTEVADLAGLRRASGLTNFATPYIDRTKVGSWLQTNSGRAISQRISEVQTIEEAQSLFPKADAAWWLEVIDAKTTEQASETLRRNLGLDRQGLNRVDDMKVGMFDDFRRKVSLRSRRSGRYGAIVPGEEFIVESGDIRDLTQTVRNADAYMRTVRAASDERNAVTEALTRGLVNNDRAAVRTALHRLQEVVIENTVASRGPLAYSNDKDVIRAMFSKFREDIEEYANFGTINRTGDPDELGGLNVLVSGPNPGDIEVRRGAKMTLDTAVLETEAKKFSTYFPDPRKLRRVTSRTSWLWAKSAQNPELYGDARGYVTALDWVQNQVWRPITLMTGGYMFRNMMESIMRQTTARGVASGPTHPLQWIQSMMGYKFIGDIEGTGWIGEAGRLARARNKEFFEATGAKVREMQDPIHMQRRALQTGRFKLVKNVKNEPDYARGVATELRLLAGDAVARRIARGESTKQIVDEFLTKADGQQYVRNLQSRWSNRMVTDANGQEVRGTVRFVDSEGYDVDNLTAFVESVRKRVELKTGGYDSLRNVVANAEDFGRFVTREGKEARAFKQIVFRSTVDDAYENFEYSDELLDEIRAFAADPATNLPEFVKIAPPLDKQMVGGKSRFQFFDKTLNHFFGSVFGKKEAFLNRSPVFRQYYYSKLNDLVNANELSQEALVAAYTGVAEGGYRYFSDRLGLLEQLKPNAAGKYTWDGRLIGERSYQKLLASAKKDLSEVSGRVRKFTQNDFEVLEVVDDAWAARYVGSEELWNKIKAAKNGTYKVPDKASYRKLLGIQPNAKGRYVVDGKEYTKLQFNELLRREAGLSLQEASFAAKAFAFEETKRVFYNAAEVNNFTDIMRIVVPFGPAWGEAMRFYGKEIITKPNRAKNLAVSVQGIRDADPDGDGKGFFFTDPTTGEMMFNYPLSSDMLPFLGAVGGAIGFETLFGAGRRTGLVAAAGAFAGAAAGLGGKQLTDNSLGGASFNLQAPAQSLSQSFQVLPGIGPVIQMAAGKILADKPQFDDIMQVVSPFGVYSDDPLGSLIPSWAKKIGEALNADPENDRYFADLYIDSFRAIYATGEFDNANPEDMARLRDRARSAARTLLILRGIGQFVGPARPDPELVVPTKFEGQVTVNDVELMVKENVPGSVLAAVFRQMQEDDYENAVVNFLQTFGDESMMYLPGLSQTTVQGLQATDLFGDWERQNKDVIAAYRDVYGYFAPVGGEFEFQTYLRQIKSGARERTTDPAELQADAEEVVGKALYINAVRQMGDNPSSATKDELRMYRTELEKQLPGFRFAPLNIEEREQTLNQLIEASRMSPGLESNDIAKAIRLYADYRDQATQEAIIRNNGVDTGSLLTRAANADLRQWLRQVGDAIIGRTPEFERVWTRVFFDEVDI